MTLVRWNPMRSGLMNTPMDRFFDELWGRVMNPENGETQAVWAPRVDITETENEYRVVADLPGMTKEEVDITLEDNELRISGERKVEHQENGEHARVLERAHGRFLRSFSLSTDVDSEKIHASFTDGVLTLTLPKVEHKKPRKIQVS